MTSLRVRLSNIYHYAIDERHRAFHRQRKITGISARERQSAALAAKLPRADDLLSAADADGGASAQELARNGWLPQPGQVRPEWVDEIRDYFAPLLARDPYRPELGRFRAPDDVPSQTHVSHYDYPDILRAPHLMRLANDPRVLALVAQAIGARPTLSAIRVWWSTPAGDGTPEHAELFHRDVDDLRFVKLFVYLTDVGEDTGPHVFVEGSQRVDRLTEVRRFSDEEVQQAFGAASIKRLTGPAGTAFLENTFGVHRGVPPTAGPRLIFQPLYAMQPLIYGPRKPLISADEVGIPLDPYVNRVFVRA
jgi:hypothetical protein